MMHASGYSLNMVTMGALVIGIGMMVDNSIVVLEMCFRKKERAAVVRRNDIHIRIHLTKAVNHFRDFT